MKEQYMCLAGADCDMKEQHICSAGAGCDAPKKRCAYSAGAEKMPEKDRRKREKGRYRMGDRQKQGNKLHKKSSRGGAAVNFLLVLLCILLAALLFLQQTGNLDILQRLFSAESFETVNTGDQTAAAGQEGSAAGDASTEGSLQESDAASEAQGGSGMQEDGGAQDSDAPQEETSGASEASAVLPGEDAAENDPVYEMVKAAVEQQQEKVELYNVSEEQAFAALEKIRRQPDYFWVSEATYYSSSLGFNSLELPLKYDNVSEKRAQVEATAADILSGIPADAGDYETAMLLHDWLCNNITYASSADGSDQDIYGALINRQCVCGGYARAFAYLLRKAGISAEMISGTATDTDGTTGNHAWNAAVLEGQIYYFDVTWDDHEDDQPGRDWFAVTSGQMASSHFPGEGEEMPESTATDCNYYYRSGRVLWEYSDEALADQIAAQGALVDLLCADETVEAQLLEALNDPYRLGEIVLRAGYSLDNSFSYSSNPYLHTLRIRIS